MSRAPTAGRSPQPEPERPSWFIADDTDMPQQIVLATADPQGDDAGRPARWYSRRMFQRGRWILVSMWVDPMTLLALDPQPTHWRIDPQRALLRMPT